MKLRVKCFVKSFEIDDAIQRICAVQGKFLLLLSTNQLSQITGFELVRIQGLSFLFFYKDNNTDMVPVLKKR